MIVVRWALLAALTSASLLAQAPARFSSGTAAVRVDVLVTNGNRPVSGLQATDFELRDNGVLQRITDVSHETLPLNVFCVLDLSGSVSGQPLMRLKEATASLFGSLRDRDRAALMTFADRLVLHAPLTGDVGRLRSVLDGVTAGGHTSFLDAAFAGLALREGDDGRALMLILSDGLDTSSWLRAAQVLDAARRTDVVVYPVTIKRPPVIVTRTADLVNPSNGNAFNQAATIRETRVDPLERLLAGLADETGGRVIFVEKAEKLQETFVQVLSEFRQRYVVSYTPSGVAGEGWHTLTVNVVGRRAQVKARRGYAAEPARRGGATRER